MIAWHYTIAEHAASIIKDGSIRRASAGLPYGELPVVWFSRRDTWEPTATKILASKTGERRRATMPEMVVIGLVRFGVDAGSLLSYRELCRAAHIRTPTQRHLEAAGRKQGALPSDWCGSVEDVPLQKVCAIEQFDAAKGRWMARKESG